MNDNATAVRTKIRKNDTVQVLAGKDRGKQGRVLRVVPATGRALVEQVNMVKRHQKPNPNRNIKGGILDKEAPISLSNLAIVCADCKKTTRIRTARTAGEGGKARAARTCARCNASLDR